MMLINLRRYLKLDEVCQGAYAEYNSKCSFIQKIKAEENKLLLRQRPFSSTMVQNDTNTKTWGEHGLVTEVVTCLTNCKYMQKQVIADCCVKDEDYVLSDHNGKFMRDDSANSVQSKVTRASSGCQSQVTSGELHPGW